ncbi:MAG TPA: hypothetical protein DD730_15690 [Desulfosporosinus sp.]|jgi:hypothetical protein|nr:hypothetical protein [Desulfosporosinus sp.]
MIDICSDLFDTLTAVKGFMQLNNENKKRKIDYSLIVIQELNNIERLVGDLCDLINKDRIPEIEEEIISCKEIEVAVPENNNLEASIPGVGKPDAEL